MGSISPRRQRGQTIPVGERSYRGSWLFRRLLDRRMSCYRATARLPATGQVRASSAGQMRAAQYSGDVMMPAAPSNPRNVVRSGGDPCPDP